MARLSVQELHQSNLQPPDVVKSDVYILPPFCISSMSFYRHSLRVEYVQLFYHQFLRFDHFFPGPHLLQFLQAGKEKKKISSYRMSQRCPISWSFIERKRQGFKILFPKISSSCLSFTQFAVGLRHDDLLFVDHTVSYFSSADRAPYRYCSRSFLTHRVIKSGPRAHRSSSHNDHILLRRILKTCRTDSYLIMRRSSPFPAKPLHMILRAAAERSYSPLIEDRRWCISGTG